MGQKLLAGAFSGFSPRTAGFNSIDYTQASEQTQRVAAVDASQQSARVETERARPTVNIEGQQVGTLINTTA